jgi:SAM-dependent methyltransferase
MIYDDAALYDLQYAAYRDDVPHYLRLADDQGGPVLELGAGTGRLTGALLAAGHEVVALDASRAMLDQAATRLGANDRLQLILGDMRDVDLGRRFPLVIAPFNTLMHAYTLDDQDRTLATVRRHLDVGGLFAFDLYRPRLSAMDVVRREPEWGDLAPNTDLFLVQHHDPEQQLLTSHYFLDERQADGAVRRRTAQLVQRYYHRFELERALRAGGLGRVQLFGDFGRGRLSADSPLLVGLARLSSA